MLSKALAPGGALHALTERNQFILWNRGKLPVNPHNLQVCNAHDPAAWVSADQALAMQQVAGPEYGVGFVFTADDPFYFLDIDGALQPDNTWSPLSTELVSMLPDAAVEVSQSGRGLHVFGKSGQLTHSNKNVPLGIELYTSGRYVALTGTNARGNADIDTTSELTAVVDRYFSATPGSTPGEWTDVPCSEWDGPTDDDELLRKALASRSAGSTFSQDKAAFADLWTADVSVLSRAYPDPTGEREYDASSADAALAQHLAFWTGKNCERVLQLMQRSGLVREKYDREDYLIRTISGSVSRQIDVYTSTHTPTDPIPIPAPMVPVTLPNGVETVAGFQFMSITEQIEYFKGCVYIRDLHRVFTPDGAKLRPEQFKTMYAGWIFTLDALNDKTTKDAWEAFTASQAVRYPKASSTCFRPQLRSGEIVNEEGRALVNVYVPANTTRIAGDVSPFLNHLDKILPNPQDRAILLAYMAACVQHIGVKFQWAPLLQGCEGNGKTLFTRCVAAAIGRQYVHYPQPADLDNKFNGWLLDRLFIGVEDVYVPDHRRELIETLKPMITAGDGLGIQFKGADQMTADICANFMLNSNHKDAIRKTRTDRRFAVFFTAQQQVTDLTRDGMVGNYFPDLYDWLKIHDGYAMVNEYLHTYDIPDELNPATTCQRAPRTSSTAEAIAVGLGGVEQEILEAVEIGRPGFCNGWISSTALNNLLESLRMTRAVPRNKRRALLQSIGYDHHPALTGGRLNNPLADGAGKPVLFIREDHPQRALPSSMVREAYEASQLTA